MSRGAGDVTIDPSFRGTTDSPHIEDGIEVTFDRGLPDQWAPKTTVYVVHPSGMESTFENEDTASADIFNFKPTDWATLHATLVRIDAARLRIEIVGEQKRPHIDLAPPET